MAGIMTEDDDEQDEQILEPDGPEVDAENDFFQALRVGDESAAAKALRTLISLDGELRGGALQALAQCFEGDCDPFCPWRLRFQLPRRGAPPKDVLLEAVRKGGIASSVEKALTKPNMNIKAAVAEVSKRTGLSWATVYKAYNAGKKGYRGSST